MIEACKSLAEQTFSDFEICISDDCSTDGREPELISFLDRAGFAYSYRRQEKNLRYDGNLRASIGLSRGLHCFLLGNDDALASPTVLRDIHDEIESRGSIGVALTDFEDYSTGRRVHRAKETALRGSGAAVAASNFRNFSFVSGLVLDGGRARLAATTKWDGSEMYQMYLACRIIAAGGVLLDIDRVAIRKDIQISHESVDSYATKPRLWPCPIVERKHTLHLIGRLVLDAIGPYVDSSDWQSISESVFDQLLMFTYPFWLFEYRRVQSWNYALGICLGMRPRNLIEGVDLSAIRRWRIAVVYGLVSILGLTTPIGVFSRLYPRLHALAKSKFGRLTPSSKYA